MKNIFLLILVFPLMAFSQQNFWEQTNGPGGGNIEALEKNSNNNIFAGTWYLGIFRSADNGDNWVQINNGLTFTYIWSFALNSSNDIFAGTGGGGVFRSIDNGDSWIEINNGLTNPYVHSLAINSSGNIFAGTNWGGIFRSTDNGENWAEINNGLTSTVVKSLLIDSNDNLFAGTSFGGGIFRSTDNGESWTEVNNGLGIIIEINALAINSSGKIFAGSWSDVFNEEGGVFYTTDNGENWIEVSNDSLNKHITSLVINSNDIIYYGTDGGGVFRSTNDGENWTEVNNGLTNKVVRSLTINSNGYIFAGTSNTSQGFDGKGVFRSINTTTSVESKDKLIPSAFSLSQNYPNPFNPKTIISYSVPQTSFITLKVYDILGKEITTLVNEEKSLGIYKTEFDGSSLPSGIYFCRMEAKSFNHTIKLILLK